jgi:hypothetical protein
MHMMTDSTLLTTLFGIGRSRRHKGQCCYNVSQSGDCTARSSIARHTARGIHFLFEVFADSLLLVYPAAPSSMVCEAVPATPTELSVWIEWAKALGPAFVSGLAVLVSTLSFLLSRQVADGQAAVAKGQLRQNVYDRRFAVYQSAKALLMSYGEKLVTA